MTYFSHCKLTVKFKLKCPRYYRPNSEPFIHLDKWCFTIFITEPYFGSKFRLLDLILSVVLIINLSALYKLVFFSFFWFSRFQNSDLFCCCSGPQLLRGFSALTLHHSPAPLQTPILQLPVVPAPQELPIPSPVPPTSVTDTSL